MDVGPGEGGPDFRPAGYRNGEGEDAVQVEAGGRQRGHPDDAGDQDRAADDVELLAVEHVELDVEHGEPDPHGRDDLHHGEAPVCVQELHPLEQHEEGTHNEGQRRQPASALAELHHRLFYGLVVAPAYGVDELPDERPGARPAGRGRTGGRGEVRGGSGLANGGGRRGGPGALRCAPVLVVHRHFRPSFRPASRPLHSGPLPGHCAGGAVPQSPPATPHSDTVIVTPGRGRRKGQRLSAGAHGSRSRAAGEWAGPPAVRHTRRWS